MTSSTTTVWPIEREPVRLFVERRKRPRVDQRHEAGTVFRPGKSVDAIIARCKAAMAANDKAGISPMPVGCRGIV